MRQDFNNKLTWGYGLYFLAWIVIMVFVVYGIFWYVDSSPISILYLVIIYPLVNALYRCKNKYSLTDVDLHIVEYEHFHESQNIRIPLSNIKSVSVMRRSRFSFPYVQIVLDEDATPINIACFSQAESLAEAINSKIKNQ